MTRIDYSSWDRPRGPRRGWSLAVAVLGGVALLSSGFFAFRLLSSNGHNAAAGSKLSLPNSQHVLIPPSQLTLGICIDPTSSIVSSFAVTIRQDLEAALRKLSPGTGPLSTDSRYRPVPAVDLTVRQVSTASFSTTQTRYIRHFVIPGIPGLARARPGPGAPVGQLRAWYVDYDKVKAARRETAKAAASAARDLSGMPLERHGSSSGISGCVSGLLQTVPTLGEHSYLVASDLQQNVAPQLAGSFHSAQLLIIQSCDTGHAALCQHYLENFKARMHQLHVGRVTVVRPEDAAQVIDEWVRTGSAPGY